MPKERSKYTSATAEPMASPSAPVWVVTAARSKPFKTFATSRVVLFSVCVCIYFCLFCLFYFSKRRFDPAHALHDRVRLEAESGRALETRLCSDGGLDASGRA